MINKPLPVSCNSCVSYSVCSMRIEIDRAMKDHAPYLLGSVRGSLLVKFLAAHCTKFTPMEVKA